MKLNTQHHYLTKTLLLVFAISLPVLAMLSSPIKLDNFNIHNYPVTTNTSVEKSIPFNTAAAKMGKFYMAYKNTEKKLEVATAKQVNHLNNAARYYFVD